jgi:hypothetical protein
VSFENYVNFLIQQRSPYPRRSFPPPYLRKTPLSKEEFPMRHLIPFAALSHNKSLNVNGSLSPNFIVWDIFPWWFVVEVVLLVVIFYRGCAPHWFLPSLCSSLIFYRSYAPHWLFTEVMLLIAIFYRDYVPRFFMPCEEGFLQIESVSKWKFS